MKQDNRVKNMLNTAIGALKRRLGAYSARTQAPDAAHVSQNPYLQSKALWHDLYGSLEDKLARSQRFNLCLLLALSVSLFGLIHLGGQSKVTPLPFIIHGEQLITLSAADSREFGRLKDKLAVQFAQLFIRHSRRVSVDRQINAQHQVQAYAMLKDSAVPTLKGFYRAHAPNTLAQKQVNTVQITSVLKESDHTMSVRWVEVWRNVRTGDVLTRSHWIAELTTHYGPPSKNALILKENPCGFYITHVAWSQDQMH